MPAAIGQFLEIFRTLDSVEAYSGSYEPWLVAISVLIAILAAFVALTVAARIVSADSRRSRWAWAIAGAVSMGGGIWSMHFIGMIAFSLPCGVSYDPLGTTLSMIPGMFASGVALYVISRKTEPDLKQLAIGAVLMGAGIGAMHYAGMTALEAEALVRYRPSLVVLSIVVAVVLAFISLGIRFRLHGSRLTTLAAATVMGCGVAGMHYTAMQASTFYPMADVVLTGWMPSTALVLAVVIGASLAAILTLTVAFAGRQMELAANLRAEMARRRLVELDAQSGRARLQAIFDAVVDAIVTIDKRGRIQQWSSGAQRIFGYTAEEAVGRELTLLMAEPHRMAHASYVERYLTTGQARIIGVGRVLTAVRKDGGEFPIEITVSEVRSGEEVFFTGILRDITERQRAEAELVRAREAAEAANRAKSQFVATMSHEIRTPMNGVLGMATLLSSTSLNDRQARLVENLMRSGQALLAIINDILDFSKIEAGRFELFAVPFDPRDLIDELTDLFSAQCARKGLEYIYFVADEVPQQVQGDPVRLRQVLINLIGNAIKFTERGEIVIELSVAGGDREHVLLEFAIEDTGIGIKPEHREQLFRSFHQVDGSMTRARGGSGLGLAISKELVELMGGSISVESEWGRGSRFAFTAEFDRPAGELEAPRPARHIGRRLRVLLADTNGSSANVISLYLANWGVDATLAANAADAAQAAQAAAAAGAPFEVAILDAKGLGNGAVELVHRLRATDREGKLDLVILLGLESLMVDHRFEQLGVTAILPKPVRPSELFDCLAAIAQGTARPRFVPRFMRNPSRATRPQFGATVLVVEDNAVNQEVAAGFLENMGCRVVAAPNGSIAVELCASERFDLVLMDCEMPLMDGLEATRRIRARESIEATHVPIIAVTAHALGEVRDNCLAAGMDDFLVKPFDERQMAELLRRWLSPGAEAAPRLPASIIDRTVVDNLRALDRKRGSSRLERAVQQFLAVAPPLAATMREKAGERDNDALWRAAHSLKSSAGVLGAMQLAQRCAEIEAAARDQDTDQARRLVEPLAEELAAAMQGLQSLIERTDVEPQHD
jgi:two-component system, sensor histidine kinase and response regulator